MCIRDSSIKRVFAPVLKLFIIFTHTLTVLHLQTVFPLQSFGSLIIEWTPFYNLRPPRKLKWTLRSENTGSEYWFATDNTIVFHSVFGNEDPLKNLFFSWRTPVYSLYIYSRVYIFPVCTFIFTRITVKWCKYIYMNDIMKQYINKKQFQNPVLLSLIHI